MLKYSIENKTTKPEYEYMVWHYNKQMYSLYREEELYEALTELKVNESCVVMKLRFNNNTREWHYSQEYTRHAGQVLYDPDIHIGLHCKFYFDAFTPIRL